jgi:hypothetical protein
MQFLFQSSFLSPFVFPLLSRPCFVPVFLAHVVSSLAYPNLLGTKRLGCCCCNAVFFVCNPVTVNISGEAMLVLGGVLAPGFIFFYQGTDPF